MDENSFHDNRNEFQSAQLNIALLIDQLDKGNRLDDVGEVSFLMSGMEMLLDKFSENSYELQHEIQEILASSRQGLLTHEMLSEMVQTEQVRSKYLTGIVGSLKLQIENLFNVLTNKDTYSEDGDSASVIEKVQDNVNLLWKSVDSLSRLIVSPAKKLDNTIRKIDSEVIVHLNKTMHLPQRAAENFGDKLEKASRQHQKNNVVTQSIKQAMAQSPGLPEHAESPRPAAVSVDVAATPKHAAPSAPGTPSSHGGDNRHKSKKDHHLKPVTHEAHGSPSEVSHPTNTPAPALSQAYPHHVTVPAGASSSSSPHAHHTSSVPPPVIDDFDGASIEVDDDDDDLDDDPTGGKKRRKSKKKPSKPKAGSTKSKPSGPANTNAISTVDDAPSVSRKQRKSIPTAAAAPVAGYGSGAEEDDGSVGQASIGTTGSKRKALPDDDRVAPRSSAQASGGPGIAARESAAPSRNAGVSDAAPKSDEAVRKAQAGSSKASAGAATKKKAAVGGGMGAAAGTGTGTGTATPGLSRQASGALDGDDASVVSMLSDPDVHEEGGEEQEGGAEERESPRPEPQSLEPQDDGVKGGQSVTGRPPRPSRGGADRASAEFAYTDDLETDSEVSSRGGGGLATMSPAQRAGRRLPPPGRAVALVTASHEESGTLYLSSVLEDDAGGLAGVGGLLGVGAGGKKRTGSPKLRQTGTAEKMGKDAGGEGARAASPKGSRRPSSPSNRDNDDGTPSYPQDHAAYGQGHNGLGHSQGHGQSQGRGHSHGHGRAARSGHPYDGDERDDDYLDLEDAGQDHSKGGGHALQGLRRRRRHGSPSRDDADRRRVRAPESREDSLLRRLGQSLGLHESDPRNSQVQDVLTTMLTNIFKEGTNPSEVQWDKIKISLPETPAAGAGSGAVGDTGGAGTVATASASAKVAAACPAVAPGESTAMGGTVGLGTGTGVGAGTVGAGVGAGDLAAPNAGRTLPIYANQADLLITRTYKPTPELQSLEAALSQAENPLQLLLQAYRPFLSHLQQERMLQACLPKDLRDHKWLQLCPELHEGMLKLSESCGAMLPVIDAVESICKNLVQIIKNLRRTEVRNGQNGDPTTQVMRLSPHEAEVVQGSVLDVVRLNGDLEAQLIANNLRLLEYRSFFDRIHALSATELTTLTRENRLLAQVYDLYLRTQGQVLEVQERLLGVKDRCQRYRVEQYLPATLLPSLNRGPGLGLAQGSMDSMESSSFAPAPIPPRIQPVIDLRRVPSLSKLQGGVHINTNRANIPASSEQCAALITELQSSLQEAELEIDDLEIELVELMKARDKTPAAILFFALMNDASYIPNLQQLVLQFGHLKQFMNYSVHMDYLTLRKRLQVCLVLMPSMEKLLDKYAIMHQAWSHVRLNWFAERKLRGGSADALAYCPLCYHNLEERDELVAAQQAQAHGAHGAHGTQATSPKRSHSAKIARQERQQVKNQRKNLVQTAQTLSLPALPSAPSLSISASASATPGTARTMLSVSSGRR